ncbi:Sjogren's syndrome/scleroderma autoantigen 1 family protein [Methanocella conradii]|uniref:Sjogren's syndrome/scleroderma autoantigen 1 family protein n=1 Tax=Methanocella conradii TaxID=1175444 RepID=UPI0024B3BEED|nr:Sjogren's syndrome/scleroderma autoantigen 1 family protein [Methanocella conradii]MDI6897803.1 Sjogren's syndrome/scleroderma autoantigen 1 family protein [Methanocella conradii]
MEERDLDKVTRMLEKGGTMLAKHCECGAPLFKYQGKVVCPVCDAKKQEHAEEQARLAVPVETKPAVSSQAVEPVKSTPVMQMPERGMRVIVGKEDLDEAAVEAAVIAKVNDIAARLAGETYPNKIQMYLDILERSLRVLKELHGISK